MRQNIFISSTIEDLQDLRDGIKEVLDYFGLNAVMSENSGIGYLTSATAEQSCYQEVQNCKLAIILIGRRYGEISENGFSVTHNEFKAAQECDIPILTLVMQEVMSFKKVYDKNPNLKNLEVPGMDSPQMTFKFIDEIRSSKYFNGILLFNRVADAKEHIKKQFSHALRFGPPKAEVRDAQPENQTFEPEMKITREGRKVGIGVLNAIRFLHEDKQNLYKSFIESIHEGSIDTAISLLKDNKTIEDYILNRTESEPCAIEFISLTDFEGHKEEYSEIRSSHFDNFTNFQGTEAGMVAYIVYKDKIIINSFGLKALNTYHKAFLLAVKGTPLDKITELFF